MKSDRKYLNVDNNFQTWDCMDVMNLDIFYHKWSQTRMNVFNENTILRANPYLHTWKMLKCTAV